VRSIYNDAVSNYTTEEEEPYSNSEYSDSEDDNMSVFSRRGLRTSGPYTNAYGNKRDGLNSPSRFSHKHRELAPNPYRKRETDTSSFSVQRQRN